MIRPRARLLVSSVVCVLSLVALASNAPAQVATADEALYDTVRAAVSKNDTAAVSSLLEQKPQLLKAQVGPLGSTLLELATVFSNREMVELLLAKGADPNGRNRTGQTPIFSVLSSGKTEIAELLIKRGADVNVRDSLGYAPLHDAAMSRTKEGVEALKFLLVNGAEVNIRDNSGQTPLHAAAIQGNIEAVQLLLANKADKDLKDKDGKTALDWAKEYQKSENKWGVGEVVRLLSSPAGAPSSEKEKPAEQQVSLGSTLYGHGQYADAEKAFRRAIDLTPYDAGTHYDLGETLYAQQRWLEAAGEYKEALRLAEGVPGEASKNLRVNAHLMLGYSNLLQGYAAAYEHELREVLRLDPNNAEALNSLGYVLVERRRDMQEALAMIERAVKAEPKNGSYLDSLGWADFRLGRLDEAERTLGEALKYSADNATIHEHLGDLYRRRGSLDAAKASWQKALALSQDEAQKGWLRLKLGVAGVATHPPAAEFAKGVPAFYTFAGLQWGDTADEAFSLFGQPDELEKTRTDAGALVILSYFRKGDAQHAGLEIVCDYKTRKISSVTVEGTEAVAAVRARGISDEKLGFIGKPRDAVVAKYGQPYSKLDAYKYEFNGGPSMGGEIQFYCDDPGGSVCSRMKLLWLATY
jgi:Flp pilus assembly protein TadD